MFERRQAPVTTKRAWYRQNVVVGVLIVFILLSALASAYTFAALFQTRRVLRAQLETAVTKIAEAREQTIHYEFPVQQSFPFSTTIDLNETIDVPINISVPIRQQINVPVEVPLLGPVELPVTLNFDVPVSTTVTVPIDKQIPINTSVDLNTTIPLDIDLGQEPLGNVLRDLEDALRELLTQF